MRVLLASLTLLLAACGFQPMYAQPGGQNAIGPVNIVQIDGMAGHVLRAELDRMLAVENDGSPPALLEITLTEQVTPRGIRVDDIPTAAFGEIAAQDDARERAAETMAQRFRAELALRMAQARAS